MLNCQGCHLGDGSGLPGVVPSMRGIVAGFLDVPGGNVDRAMGDIHAMGNPHYTLDPGNAVLIAREMASRMGKLDPENNVAYEARAEAFAQEIAGRMPVWRSQLDEARTKSIILYSKNHIIIFNFRL